MAKAGRDGRWADAGCDPGARQPGTGAEAPQHRHADDRRHRLERFRRLFGRWRGARPSDAERRSIAKEGAVFTSWYGQASCTAGRASFITGRIPIRSALSIVVAPGDENYLRKETPTIAEFFKKNGYSTYFSGKWHLGDKPVAYPIEHGFDEMKNFAAYYAGVYTYDYTNKWFHPWFPSYNPEFAKCFSENVNLGEWEGVAGQPATKSARSPTTGWPPSTSAGQLRRRVHQAARERRQAVLHGRQLHQDAQPDQCGAGL